MSPNWTFEDDTYLYGTPEHGCGVFEYNEHEAVLFNGKWAGNVSAYEQVYFLDNFDTKEQAQGACLDLLFHLEKEYGDSANEKENVNGY